MSRHIVVPDNVYNDAEKLAATMGITPEELFIDSTERVILKHLSDEEFIARVTKVCETEDTSLDPIIEQLQAEAIGNEEW